MKLLAMCWSALILMYIVGMKLRNRKEKLGWVESAMNFMVYLLVLLMGLRMGANKEIVDSLGTIGIQSLIVTVITIVMSVLGITLSTTVLSVIYGYLIHSSLMPSAFKLSVEELVHDAFGGVVVDKPSWHDKHIGIVVLSYQMGNLGCPCQSGTYVLMLVQCHGNTLATSADADAGKHLALLNALGKRMTEVGIVATVFGQCAVILVFQSMSIEILFHVLLERKPCMIGCNTNWLFLHNFLI